MKILRKYENIQNYENIIITILILLGVVSVILRLLPHAPNFAPIGALALFIGFYSTRKLWLLFPLAAMLISDAFIGFYDWKLMTVVYSSFLIYGLLGWIIKNQRSFVTMVSATMAGALFFFLATNFAVWIFGNVYSHTWEGLMLCYTMALPFFRNTLFGDLFYIVVYVTVYELSIKYLPSILKLEINRKFATLK